MALAAPTNHNVKPIEPHSIQATGRCEEGSTPARPLCAASPMRPGLRLCQISCVRHVHETNSLIEACGSRIHRQHRVEIASR